MIYILIDESGDIGNPENSANSKDFALSACICDSKNMDKVSEHVEKFVIRLKKKELKFSKMSPSEIRITKLFLSSLTIDHVSVYFVKNKTFHGKYFLEIIIRDLLNKIEIDPTEKVKLFIDGVENKFYRKIYESAMRKRFPKSQLKFANSIKKPLIQVADFYAGHTRRIKKG